MNPLEALQCHILNFVKSNNLNLDSTLEVKPDYISVSCRNKCFQLITITQHSLAYYHTLKLNNIVDRLEWEDPEMIPKLERWLYKLNEYNDSIEKLH